MTLYARKETALTIFTHSLSGMPIDDPHAEIMLTFTHHSTQSEPPPPVVAQPPAPLFDMSGFVSIIPAYMPTEVTEANNTKVKFCSINMQMPNPLETSFEEIRYQVYVKSKKIDPTRVTAPQASTTESCRSVAVTAIYQSPGQYTALVKLDEPTEYLMTLRVRIYFAWNSYRIIISSLVSIGE